MSTNNAVSAILSPLQLRESAAASFFDSVQPLSEAHAVLRDDPTLDHHEGRIAVAIRFFKAESALGQSFRALVRSYERAEDQFDEQGLLVSSGLLSFLSGVHAGLNEVERARMLKNVKELLRKEGHPALPADHTLTVRQGKFLPTSPRKKEVSPGAPTNEGKKEAPSGAPTDGSPGDTGAPSATVVGEHSLLDVEARKRLAQATVDLAAERKALAESKRKVALLEADLRTARTQADSLRAERDEARRLLVAVQEELERTRARLAETSKERDAALALADDTRAQQAAPAKPKPKRARA